MISIILPLYDEQENLWAFHDRLCDAVRCWIDDYEVIVVDDGSTDESLDILREFHEQDPRWKVLSLSRNFGQQTAISAGLDHAEGDAVAIMDSDLQDSPEDLSRLLEKWREGYEVVYAIRTHRKENFFARTAYAIFYRLLRRLASIDVPLDSGDFCVMDRTVVDVLRTCRERTRFVRGLRSWAGFRQIGVEIERQPRHAGKPKYTLPKLFRLAFDGILSFSNMPLKIASWMGMVFCVFSFMVIFAILGWWVSDVRLFGMHPANAIGPASLVSCFLMVSGIQLLVLGLMGEYLARIFDEVKSRPPWVIAEAIGFELRTCESRLGLHSAPPDATARDHHLRQVGGDTIL